ncbi:putative drug exporter of the RND superfamily [Nonomuraea solani]|uniref:Putative drug exporter of the RND superfamily n=1 Tax=Nonomuraea solani TaxID=1144553 RepID=A0A1H6EZM3_9ACTN|nr:MMPL family transporter [Nonomuraea solani]SEH03347.1 putative drug exporter of the RND superfamily [Nonomuraea solani]
MIRFCIRHRRLVVLFWLALTAALIAAASTWPGPSDDDFTLPGSESRQAAELLGEAAEEPPGALVVSAPSGVEAAPVREAVTGLVTRMNTVPGVHVSTAGQRVSQDGTIVSIPIDYPGEDAALRLTEFRDEFQAQGVTVELAGDDFADFTPGGLTEGIGLVAAAVVLLIAFRSLMAAAVPLLIGVIGVTCGVALLTVLSNIVSAPSFAVYLTIMLGLGVGIDYALLIVTRFRTALGNAAGTHAAPENAAGTHADPGDKAETDVARTDGAVAEAATADAASADAAVTDSVVTDAVVTSAALAAGEGPLAGKAGAGETGAERTVAEAAGGAAGGAVEETVEEVVEEAVMEAMRTAGRSVLFAGLIVVVTGSGILFLGPSLGGGVALAAGCGVLMVMLASLTLLPALLRTIGARIGSGPDGSARRQPLAYRWSRVVQRRPWVTGAAALVALVAMAVPATQLRVGWSDASNRPATDTTRRAHDLLAQGFGPGMAGPLILAIRDTPGRTEGSGAGAYLDEVAATPGVAQAFPVGERSAVVVPTTGPQDERTEELIHRLRATLPAPVLVTGSTAAALDYARHSAGRLPWVVGAVLLAAFALLVPVFRSLVLPLKAIAVNLLSIGAAYGVIVAVFQFDVLGQGTAGPIDAWVPMMLFTIMFGLSMDYEVFLLSRIREEYLKHRDNSRAVAGGLAATARVITAAATIMFCVFAAFGAFDDRALRIMGVGLAVAVLVDATVVRLVLVPATMEILGARNWWFPSLTFRRLTLRRNVT